MRCDREGLLAEQREHHLRREQHLLINQLIRRFHAFRRDYLREAGVYHNESKPHAARMKALDRETEALKRLTEALQELLTYPEETLLDNKGFLALRDALPDPRDVLTEEEK